MKTERESESGGGVGSSVGFGGITKEMREGAQAWKDKVTVNPYRDIGVNSQEYKDWSWGWDESQNYFEWQESMSNGTLEKI